MYKGEYFLENPTKPWDHNRPVIGIIDRWMQIASFKSNMFVLPSSVHGVP